MTNHNPVKKLTRAQTPAEGVCWDGSDEAFAWIRHAYGVDASESELLFRVDEGQDRAIYIMEQGPAQMPMSHFRPIRQGDWIVVSGRDVEHHGSQEFHRWWSAQPQPAEDRMTGEGDYGAGLRRALEIVRHGVKWAPDDPAATVRTHQDIADETTGALARAIEREIVAALGAKQARNEARAWPDWRTAPPDRAIEHVRREDEA